MMQPPQPKYGSQRTMKVSSGISSGWLPRCACSTRTIPPAWRRASTFQIPLPAIAAVLLEHARAGGLQARRKLRTKGFGAVVTMRIGAPAQMARAVEDVLDAHLQNDIGMRADPWTL